MTDFTVVINLTCNDCGVKISTEAKLYAHIESGGSVGLDAEPFYPPGWSKRGAWASCGPCNEAYTKKYRRGTK